jgi:hypothetical protein
MAGLQGVGGPIGSCAVTAIRVCPEATILSRSVAEAQYPHARIAAQMGGFADLVGVGAGDADWGDLCGAAC